MAVSLVGLSMLGILGASITTEALILSVLIVGFIGIIGRWLDSAIDEEAEWEDV